MKENDFKNLIYYEDATPEEAIRFVYNEIFPLFNEKKSKDVQITVTNGLFIAISFTKRITKQWHIFIYKDKKIIKTYNYNDNEWLSNLDDFEETILK